MHNFTLITYLAPQSRARFSVERARVCVHDKKRNVFQINDTSRGVRVRASERVDPCARPHHLCCARIGNGYFWRKTTSTVGIIFIDSCILGQRRREGWRVGFLGAGGRADVCRNGHTVESRRAAGERLDLFRSTVGRRPRRRRRLCTYPRVRYVMG